MTKDEFQEKYHNYETQDKDDANAECKKVNSALINGKVVVAYFVQFNRYTLMLEESADYVGQTF